ncbi:MAG: manganese-dependent inorganic pyrophosphatase [Gordonibacter sp.]|uniref:manganese-dependent inorganic pyrophosphatase n=1 Tax=Gordonibacter sp. TaxID=1968902 RepID=UPI002FCAEEB1
MAEPIIVVGHKNPDNDSISAAVGYAYLKNELARRAAEEGEAEAYEPVRLGPLPPESSWVLGSVGIEEPRLIENVRTDDDALKQRVVLVDHNEVRQAADGIEEAEIVEIVDHHRIGGMVTASPIMFLNLPLGSTASIVVQEFERNGVELPDSIAKVLLSAILTDTVILKSPTATAIDRAIVEKLSAQVGVDPTEFGLAVFKQRGGEGSMPIKEFVCADSKEFQAGDATVLIAQHETVDLAGAMEREDEARELMRGLCEEHGYRFVLLMVTDIIAEGSQFICEGDCELVNRVFGIECAPGGVWMPGILSRKKQVAAKILGA